MGMAEGLQDLIYGPVTEKQGKALTSIYNSGLHLLDLINDILDVSKLNADKLELTLELCSLNQLCLTSLQMVKELAHKKNQVVHYSIMPNVIELLVDSRRLKQILVNLLSNAIKFTGERKHLGLDVHGDKENQMVILAVWDEGIGIKQEDFEKLFHPFVQLDSRLSRQQTGTGLGLVLVQNLIELHGGSLTIESTYGEGSRFIVRLPWKAASPDDMLLTGDLRALPSDHPTSIPVLTTNLPLIMLVDDDEINIEAISSYMRSKKYRIVTARNGWEFLENVDSIQPDMILMDIQMPGMDGIEAIQRLRMHSEPAIANIPVIAITALAMPGDHEKCLTAGANAYFSKPLHLNELAVAISDLLSNNQKKAS
jgi:CheY-like chemotaxis protein